MSEGRFYFGWPYLWLRRATMTVNLVSCGAMLFLNPHPFYLAAMIGMFGGQSWTAYIWPLLFGPLVVLIGCMTLSTMTARRGWRFAPAIAALPLLAAAAWQLYPWQQPNA